MRPDELSTISAIGKSQEEDRYLQKGLKAASSIAGIGIGAKMLPFLSEYIPSELAMKGISKLNPTLGKYLKKGVESGLDLRDGLDFIRDNLMKGKEVPSQEKKPNFKPLDDVLNDLHNSSIGQYIRFTHSKGADPMSIAAHIVKKDQEKVRQLEEETGENFENIIQAYIKKIGSRGATDQTPINRPSPQEQSQSSGMQNLLKALEAAAQRRQR